MLQLYRFFRGEKGLEQTDIYYQAHVLARCCDYSLRFDARQSSLSLANSQ